MRTLATILLATVIPVTACAQSDTAATDAISVFDRACLETGAQRAQFEQVAAANTWPSLPMPPSENEDGNWAVAYQASPNINVVLRGNQARRGPPPGVGVQATAPGHYIPEARHCEIYANAYPDDWRDRLDALVIDGKSLGEHQRTSTTRESPPPAGVEVVSWGEPIDGRMVRATHDPSRGLQLSLALINHGSLRALDPDRP